LYGIVKKKIYLGDKLTQAGLYENELKRILNGDEKTLNKATKSMNDREKEAYLSMKKYPFIVIRSTGSLGIADLVAIRSDLSMLIEVKARTSNKIMFSNESGRVQRAAEEMWKQCNKSGVMPIFAFRIKGYHGDAWRLFTLKVSSLSGKAKEVNAIIPKLSITKSMNFYIVWEDGMKLSDFIRIINRMDD